MNTRTSLNRLRTLPSTMLTDTRIPSISMLLTTNNLKTMKRITYILLTFIMAVCAVSCSFDDSGLDSRLDAV